MPLPGVGGKEYPGKWGETSPNAKTIKKQNDEGPTVKTKRKTVTPQSK